MSDIEKMQSLLDTVLTRIEEIEDKIKTAPPLELRDLKKALACQQRVKITLIKSIQELKPSSNTMTIFSSLKNSSFFSKIKSFFRG